MSCYPRSVNILLTPVGIKFFLTDIFRNNLETIGGKLVTVDMLPTAPARNMAHHFYTVPPLNDPLYPAKIQEILKKHNISAILPTRQQEFAFWCDFVKTRPQFQLMLSRRETVDICANKKSSYDWLQKNNFPVTPYALKSDGGFEEIQKTLGALPWFGKPFDGSASIGAGPVTSREEFEKLSPETMLQTVWKGVEYTINCYVDRAGHCRAVVPHHRIEVKDDEVSVGIIVKNPYLLALGKRLAEALPGAYGPLCFQIFYDPAKGPMSDKSVTVTDLNARFGGGYPLCHAAGGKFVDWLIMEAEGKTLPEKLPIEDGVRFWRLESGLTFAHPATANHPEKKVVVQVGA